jgi:hypothetical protein
MRFSSTYSRPTLTPLGQRLLVLSERKLYDLDAPIGARESGTALFREVLIRETVRTAWTAVEEGREVELSDWSQPNAMGLDVIGEEEEEVEKEDRWFEDLLSELGDGDEEQPTHIEYILPSLSLISPPPSLPITPIDEATHPYLPTLDEIDEEDSLTLPPLLHRSWYADSSSSSDDDECVTPTFDCMELEESTGGFKWGKGVIEDDWDEMMFGGREVRMGDGGVRFRGF